MHAVKKGGQRESGRGVGMGNKPERPLSAGESSGQCLSRASSPAGSGCGPDVPSEIPPEHSTLQHTHVEGVEATALNAGRKSGSHSCHPLVKCHQHCISQQLLQPFGKWHTVE